MVLDYTLFFWWKVLDYTYCCFIGKAVNLSLQYGSCTSNKVYLLLLREYWFSNGSLLLSSYGQIWTTALKETMGFYFFIVNNDLNILRWKIGPLRMKLCLLKELISYVHESKVRSVSWVLSWVCFVVWWLQLKWHRNTSYFTSYSDLA